MLGVVPFEVLRRVPRQSVERSLGIHDVRVRLLAVVNRAFGRVDRPLVGVAVAQLLRDECLHELLALNGRQLTGERHLDFTVGCAVRPLMLIGCVPEVRCALVGPCGHVASALGFEVFIAVAAAVLSLAGNVRGVGSGFAFGADFDRAVVGGHGRVGVGCFPKGARFSQRNN